MWRFLKLSPQVGSRVRTRSLSGIVSTVTREHVLLKVSGWCQRETQVWVARNQLRGMYK
jgi:hypothetical protein